MKVQLPTGELKKLKPGDKVPDEIKWTNAAAWIRRGYMQPADEKTALGVGYNREHLSPNRPATEEDALRGRATKAASLPVVEKVPEPAFEKVPEPAIEDGTKGELMKLSRADLEQLALEEGVDEPTSFANKEALAEAILEKNSA